MSDLSPQVELSPEGRLKALEKAWSYYVEGERGNCLKILRDLKIDCDNPQQTLPLAISDLRARIQGTETEPASRSSFEQLDKVEIGHYRVSRYEKQITSQGFFTAISDISPVLAKNIASQRGLTQPGEIDSDLAKLKGDFASWIFPYGGTSASPGGYGCEGMLITEHENETVALYLAVMKKMDGCFVPSNKPWIESALGGNCLMVLSIVGQDGAPRGRFLCLPKISPFQESYAPVADDALILPISMGQERGRGRYTFAGEALFSRLEEAHRKHDLHPYPTEQLARYVSRYHVDPRRGVMADLHLARLKTGPVLEEALAALDLKRDLETLLSSGDLAVLQREADDTPHLMGAFSAVSESVRAWSTPFRGKGRR